MRILYDSSALVALYIQPHPDHKKIVDHHLDFLNDETDFFISSHSLAELFHTITKGISYLNLTANEANNLIHNSVLPLFTTVSLIEDDYSAVLHCLKERNLTGGIIYDGLIARAAEKIAADHLVTFNIKDFKRVWPLTEADLIEP